MKKIQVSLNRVDSRSLGEGQNLALWFLGLGLSSLLALPLSTQAQQNRVSVKSPAAKSSARTQSLKTSPKAAPTAKKESAPTSSDLKYEGSAGVIAAEDPLEAARLAKKFSGYVSMQYSMKAYESVTGRDRDSLSYTLGTGYQLNNLYSLGASASIYNNADELEEREQLKLSSVALSASRAAVILSRGYSLRPSVSLRLPVGKDTVKRESLRLGVNPSAQLSLPIADWTNLPKLSAGLQLSGFWNFHEYKQSAAGSSNNQYGLTTAARLGYSLPKNVRLSTSVSYNSAWTYRDSQIESIGHSESVSWTFHENASVSLGHSNRGPLFAYAGVNYDFSLLSEKSSYFFGDLTVSF